MQPYVMVDGLRVPAALGCLWEALQAQASPDGLYLEGIFRKSANADHLTELKQKLESACYDAASAASCPPREGLSESELRAALLSHMKGADGHCLAALMKLHLREMPDDLWAPVRGELDAMIDADEEEHDEATAGGGGGSSAAAASRADGDVPRRLTSRLSPAARDVVVFILRVMSNVQALESSNRMNKGALVTVFGPGLVHPNMNADEGDALALLAWSEYSVKWTKRLFESHQASPFEGSGSEAHERAGSARPCPPAADGNAEAVRSDDRGDAAVDVTDANGAAGGTSSVPLPEAIRAAIQIGATAYNNGDPTGCCWLYMRTAELILEGATDLGNEVSVPLRAALQSAQADASKVADTERAWRMRQVFDALLDLDLDAAAHQMPSAEALYRQRPCVSKCIVDAIKVGAPLYNGGNVPGCVRVYRRVAEEICARVPATSATAKALKPVLKEVAKLASKKDGDEKSAWALRRVFDRLRVKEGANDPTVLGVPSARSVLSPLASVPRS